jgi:hypothetical protein
MRLRAMKCLGLAIFQLLLVSMVSGQETIIKYLSGKDKDHTVNWEFWCSSGMNSNKWGKIAVPSNWEVQGYGTYNYGKDVVNPDEHGIYKFSFEVPASWKNKRVYIVFEASMTDTRVLINDVQAGPIHQGAFYEFEYDISKLLSYGASNKLQVEVRKKSANESINRAERQSDFWIFGGIFRPVYLKVLPSSFIERVAIDAKADGQFTMDVFTQNGRSNQLVEAVITDLKGKRVGVIQATPVSGKLTLSTRCNGVKAWNPEQPNLYQVQVNIKEGKKIIQRYHQRFGFRTVEVRKGDGIYVNGTRVIFKGVNRHSTWPESGKTLSREIHLLDIKLMKDMNMNAVRMSHYPPDREFLDLCDSLGLFVLDELTGWQKAYDTTTARRLVRELVVRDVNHPSIVLWANGNEGGWNRAVDNDFRLYDPQDRLVYHPWERFNNVNTKHYPVYDYVVKEKESGDIFFPTEFMHGLFDGGHGAALKDFWAEMMKNPRSAGGFLWSFHDEGVRRRDRHDSIDVAGNLAPDGILGPHREKEASFFAIKNIWSPVSIGLDNIDKYFAGSVPVTNNYLYTNLNAVRFKWEWLKFPGPHQNGPGPVVLNTGSVTNLQAKPGGKSMLSIPVDKALLERADALRLTAFDAKNETINTWSWPVKIKRSISHENKSSLNSEKLSISDRQSLFKVTCDGVEYTFDKNTGFLKQVSNRKNTISLHDGPALADCDLPLQNFTTVAEKGVQHIYTYYKNDSCRLDNHWVFAPGKMPELQYSYSLRPVADYSGITFKYPEEKIRSMKWLGRGPYRVWKNRQEGVQWGVWEKEYNNTITGESWVYPEFKGWHAQVAWVTVNNSESSFSIYTGENLPFFQMLQPAPPVAARNNHTAPPFPGNTIGIFKQVSPIGTKFQDAALLGPQSQKNHNPSGNSYSGTLWFEFGDKP